MWKNIGRNVKFRRWRMGVEQKSSSSSNPSMEPESVPFLTLCGRLQLVQHVLSFRYSSGMGCISRLYTNCGHQSARRGH